MIKNYLKIAWRNLLKNKSFSFINIFGLSIGLAACMVIFLYVQNELTFDRYNTKAERIVRVSSLVHAPESDINLATSSGPLADILKRDYPEVEFTVRLEEAPQVIKAAGELFKEDAFYKTDQSIFSIFDFEFLEGTASGALYQPHSVVLTKTIAKKYFGNKSALSKIMICNGQNLIVSAVVKDRPANSDIHIDALLSADFSKTSTWGDFDLYTFILFKDKTALTNFERKLSLVAKKYVEPLLNTDGSAGYSAQFELEPLAEVHFSKGKLMDRPKGNRQFSYIFSLLALFILIIALLNYINLSTAKSMERAREVGIRKVSGARPLQLIRQFLFESFLLVAIAWIFAVALVILGLPFFNNLLQTKLAVNRWQTIWFMGIVFVATLLLAGLYPAFVLSSFNPVKVLKGSLHRNVMGVRLGKTVTVAQFAIAAALIMGTTVIYQQMKYIEQKDLGFNKEQLVNIYLPRDSVYQHTLKVFQQELKKLPEIQDMTIGSGMTEDGMTIVVPRTLVKTREISRHVVTVDIRGLAAMSATASVIDESKPSTGLASQTRRQIKAEGPALTLEGLTSSASERGGSAAASCLSRILELMVTVGLDAKATTTTIQYGSAATSDEPFNSILTLTPTGAWSHLPFSTIGLIGDDEFVKHKLRMNEVAAFYRPDDARDPSKRRNELIPSYLSLVGKESALTAAVSATRDVIARKLEG